MPPACQLFGQGFQAATDRSEMLENRLPLTRLLRFIGPIIAAYCVLGLLVEAAVPHLIPAVGIRSPNSCLI